MATLEERVAYLEGQVSEQSHGLPEIRDAVRSLEHRVDVRFEAVDKRFEAIDRRFDAVDGRFESLQQRIEARFETVDRRIDSLDDKVSRQIHSLDDKVSRHFVWFVGVQVTTLVAIVGALLSRP